MLRREACRVSGIAPQLIGRDRLTAATLQPFGAYRCEHAAQRCRDVLSVPVSACCLGLPNPARPRRVARRQEVCAGRHLGSRKRALRATQSVAEHISAHLRSASALARCRASSQLGSSPSEPAHL